jgi:HSP20 family molecular chaperone IbpA
MVRRFHRSIYEELDELRASMDYLYQLALEPADNPLLPEGEVPGMICQSVHNLNTEVTEHDDELTVTLDMVPGPGTLKISVELINENTIKITCHRETERTNDNDTDCRCERLSFSLHHVIPLPCQVAAAGARMSLINSVLDIHLKKVRL